MAVYLDVAGDAFDGVLFCAVCFPTRCWMRSGTELSQFLGSFLPTLVVNFNHCRFWKFKQTFELAAHNRLFQKLRIFGFSEVCNYYFHGVPKGNNSMSK